ncbi:hypothetical protein Krac_2301 [Ktedonobacter racemifer DSM 44963]|uniref:Uncharacterized protein n=1 Tax=Ktedonobacter racemifer DSM 44963 TaxID=485913 RepID=D6U4Y9_KTERA|nr:hypothetical protein Krac_2301 [Ktedonobacter racemifer DSM 44963]
MTTFAETCSRKGQIVKTIAAYAVMIELSLLPGLQAASTEKKENQA